MLVIFWFSLQREGLQDLNSSFEEETQNGGDKTQDTKNPTQYTQSESPKYTRRENVKSFEISTGITISLMQEFH